jgi:hypothetical protein
MCAGLVSADETAEMTRSGEGQRRVASVSGEGSALSVSERWEGDWRREGDWRVESRLEIGGELMRFGTKG